MKSFEHQVGASGKQGEEEEDAFTKKMKQEIEEEKKMLQGVTSVKNNLQIFKNIQEEEKQKSRSPTPSKLKTDWINDVNGSYQTEDYNNNTIDKPVPKKLTSILGIFQTIGDQNNNNNSNNKMAKMVATNTGPVKKWKPVETQGLQRTKDPKITTDPQTYSQYERVKKSRSGSKWATKKDSLKAKSKEMNDVSTLPNSDDKANQTKLNANVTVKQPSYETKTEANNYTKRVDTKPNLTKVVVPSHDTLPKPTLQKPAQPVSPPTPPRSSSILQPNLILVNSSVNANKTVQNAMKQKNTNDFSQPKAQNPDYPWRKEVKAPPPSVINNVSKPVSSPSAVSAYNQMSENNKPKSPNFEIKSTVSKNNNTTNAPKSQPSYAQKLKQLRAEQSASEAAAAAAAAVTSTSTKAPKVSENSVNANFKSTASPSNKINQSMLNQSKPLSSNNLEPVIIPNAKPVIQITPPPVRYDNSISSNMILNTVSQAPMQNTFTSKVTVTPSVLYTNQAKPVATKSANQSKQVIEIKPSVRKVNVGSDFQSLIGNSPPLPSFNIPSTKVNNSSDVNKNEIKSDILANQSGDNKRIVFGLSRPKAKNFQGGLIVNADQVSNKYYYPPFPSTGAPHSPEANKTWYSTSINPKSKDTTIGKETARVNAGDKNVSQCGQKASELKDLSAPSKFGNTNCVVRVIPIRQETASRNDDQFYRSRGLTRSSTAEILRLIKEKTKNKLAHTKMGEISEDVEIDVLLAELKKRGIENMDWGEIGIGLNEVQNIVDNAAQEDSSDLDESDEDEDEDNQHQFHYTNYTTTNSGKPNYNRVVNQSSKVSAQLPKISIVSSPRKVPTNQFK